MRLRLRCILVGVAALAVASPALAQTKPAATDPPAAPAEPKTKEQLEAQQHFQRAKELYSAGSYREAITELEAARALDPKAKDLAFNLGVVHEKLGKFDEAIQYFRQYLELEGVTPQERAKAETIIKRIEGAKREVPTTPPPSAGGSAPPVTPPPAAEKPPHGRIDAATITAGSVAVLGLGLGATLGIIAVANQPSSTFVTGRDGTYAELEAKASDAHTQALVADISLGVGVVAAAVTAWLYFGRTRDPQAAAPAQGRAVTPAAAPVRGGGVVVLGGSFR